MPWIKYIFFTVLMSVLLITVYGKTKINIKCSDQNGTVGRSLNLTCSVSNPCGYIHYSFKRNNIILQNETTPMNSTCTFYYTIANAKVNDSGNYTFWIQMAKGWNDAIFTVTIDIPVKQAGTTSSSKQDSSTAVPFSRGKEQRQEGINIAVNSQHSGSERCNGSNISSSLCADVSLADHRLWRTKDQHNLP
ncbi:hypothetical protein HF521_020849 [Silurus meridionalis]|uniref:Immunoglobulin domain-containing protein n=1 Tax=Silurus meridionalis TaxID=175797 RepID=A0A8T0BHI6_SILME|nr:hypothetical protein HF521_020849 [Silurus meridionalis]